jgi:hypothetical protein
MLKSYSKFTDASVDICVADPDPGSGAFLTPESGRMGKKNEDPDLGLTTRNTLIRDLGWKKIGSGMAKIWIRDPQHWLI